MAAETLGSKYVVEHAMHTIDGAFAAGAFGVVYTGRRRSDNAPVAIKFSKCGDGPRAGKAWRDLFAEPEQRPLLLEEPLVHRAASALGHPGICALHDVYEEDIALPELSAQHFDRPGRTHRLVIVLDLLTGHDLYDVLAGGMRPAPVLAPLAGEAPRSRPFNEVDKRNMFAQVAGAVAALHGAGIVHRDIKPHNIVMKSPPAPGVTPSLALIDLCVGQGGKG
jgi:serine/threonine protein kinase